MSLLKISCRYTPMVLNRVLRLKGGKRKVCDYEVNNFSFRYTSTSENAPDLKYFLFYVEWILTLYFNFRF